MREGACAEQVLGGTQHCDRAEPAVAMFLKGLMSSGSLSKEAVTLFFDGATSEDPPVMEKHGWVTRPSFLPPDRWALLIALVDQTDCLHWVPQHLAEHQDEWGAWCAGPRPEAAALPPTPHEVSPLERLLLLFNVTPFSPARLPTHIASPPLCMAHLFTLLVLATIFVPKPQRGHSPQHLRSRISCDAPSAPPLPPGPLPGTPLLPRRVTGV